MNVRRKRLRTEDATLFLDTLFQLDIRVVPTTFAASIELFALAQRFELTVYDAAYLNLAIRYDLPLATTDKALLKAAAHCSIATLGVA